MRLMNDDGGLKKRERRFVEGEWMRAMEIVQR